MSGYRVIMGARCEEAHRKMIDRMVEQIKKAMSHHDTVIFSLVTLSDDAKIIEERLRERMPDVKVTIDIGVGIGPKHNNLNEWIIHCKRKEHFPTLMWKDIKELKEEDK